MSPLLSVVMPTRNRAHELSNAAASVLTQDADLELVVVDDHSDDTTAAELDNLARADRRVRVLRVTEGALLGPCEARNRGIAMASGELVGFCDDDDRWAPGAAAAVIAFLDEHPEVVAASAWHEVSHVESGRRAVFRGPTQYESRHLLWQNVVGVPFVVIRRHAVADELSFDPALPTGEDWDLVLRCARHGAVHTVPTVGYVYTQHSGRRQSRAAPRQIEGRRAFVSKHGPAMSPRCRLYHDAVLAGYDGGRSAMTARLRGALRHAPVDSAVVAAVLGMSLTASRVGQRRGDPGLQARLMVSAVDRLGRG